MVEKIPLLLCAFQARQFCSWTGLKCLTLKLTIWSTLSTAGPHVCASQIPHLSCPKFGGQHDNQWNNGEVEKTGQQRLGTLVHVAMSLLSGGLGPRDGYINRPVFLDGLLIRYTRFRYKFFCEISNMIPLEGLEGLMMRQYVFVRWAFIADHVWQCTPAAKTDQTTVILVDDESSWLYQQGLQQW